MRSVKGFSGYRSFREVIERIVGFLGSGTCTCTCPTCWRRHMTPQEFPPPSSRCSRALSSRSLSSGRRRLFGGLVWILVASSRVPVPLLQGWVMFVSLTTFFLSSVYLSLFITGLADRINTDWNVLDVVYHFWALLFYFAAFVLEAATTAANGGARIKALPNSTETVLCITQPRGNIFTVLNERQYGINVAATVSVLYLLKSTL
uniref:Mal, T cell differentiation protein 2 n=1 Tax=Gasterosteus aculeatus aculeatus TaxID=481459 RepID=A0AAQ4S034_GASAC